MSRIPVVFYGRQTGQFYLTLPILPYLLYIDNIYSPIGSALECRASVMRPIHSSSELKGALRRPTTCSDQVGIVDWGCLIHESQDSASVGQHDLRIKAGLFKSSTTHWYVTGVHKIK